MMNGLRQRIEIDLHSGGNDASEFLALVTRAVSGELEAEPVQEVFMIRIDNWFDHKWLNFSGIGRVPFGWNTGMSYNPDALKDFVKARRRSLHSHRIG
jgi:hypothetical protein